MASKTQFTKLRRRLHLSKAGRDRKKYLNRHGTTPPMAVLFGDVKETKETK